MGTLKWRKPLKAHDRIYINSERTRLVTGEAKEHRERLFAILSTEKAKPCTDCGQTYPPEVMQFDHRDPAEKRFNISEWRYLFPSEGVLRDEIAKCDLVCANCHAVRTQTQRRAGVVMRRKI